MKLPHPHVLWALGGIFAILVVATVVVWAIRRARPGLDLGEVPTRIRTWWVMAAVFAVALGLDRNVSLVFFAFLSFLALKEYLSLIPTRKVDRKVLLLAYLAIPVQYWWVATEWYLMFLLWVPVYMFLLLPLRMVLDGETSGFLRAAGTLHWGLMMMVFSLSHVAYLLVMEPPVGRPTENAMGTPIGGPPLVLFLVFLTQFNDVAQFLFGKAFGRHKVVPRVSPNKTWEGLLGGVGTTLLLSVAIAPWLTPFTTAQAVAAGAILGLGGFVGDIVVSALKRDLGIKDSGSLLPGHGGMLDRIDSLLYTAPLLFHYVAYLHM